MKYLLPIIFVLLGCTGKDPQPKHTSMDGSWRFAQAPVSGNFVIKADYVESGEFVVNGLQFTAFRRKIQDPSIYLNEGGLGTVALIFVTPNQTYDTLKAQYYKYHSGGPITTVNAEMIITRTK